ncbi:RpiB/LacA/LacB family sugar-phosphate isomerase [Patescibacteria group bacterium]|nr:RpiB/LacA/LacB family sugar-phosphate isomerase [Patescibacteria group bacterium]
MIYIAADHRGYRLKEELKKWLEKGLYEFRDLGANEYDKEDDYPIFAFKLCETVLRDNGRGILLCGSGAGASIASNKVKGIRAGLCTSPKQAVAARTDDNINVLCLSSDWVSLDDNEKILEAYLNTLFSSEERHVRRINQIKDYESSTSK